MEKVKDLVCGMMIDPKDNSGYLGVQGQNLLLLRQGLQGRL